MKKLLLITMLASFALFLSACNTINGVGKDVQKAGEVVQDAAKK